VSAMGERTRNAALLEDSGTPQAFVARLHASSIMLDGEGVVCGEDGVSNFDALHSKQRDADVFLYAFDLLELDREDQRQARLVDRKTQA
jgi:ATP-dependent DNA ligase